jgi:hypothetical protein
VPDFVDALCCLQNGFWIAHVAVVEGHAAHGHETPRVAAGVVIQNAHHLAGSFD